MNYSTIPTPAYVVSEKLLRKNLEILKGVKERTGCKILLATKCFSMYSTFDIIAQYLDGVTSSSLHEARLGHEEMGKEVHIFSPAYIPSDFEAITQICDHIVFNSPQQYNRYSEQVKGISCGIRINPQYSEQEHAIYDPCAPGSRMGTVAELLSELPQGIEGLHFHTLCQQGAEALAATFEHVEQKFGHLLTQLKWLNFGGGHHISREDYNIDLLVDTINYAKKKYDLQVYLEPGEAVALNAGFLVASVLDFIPNGGVVNSILDTSAACHMPDVIEMPYRPPLQNSAEAGEKAHTYRFGGPTCLAGDIIGDYSFDKELAIGDRVIFEDMAIYSMVKNNTFNGVNLPSIYLERTDGTMELIKQFGYEDFKSRL